VAKAQIRIIIQSASLRSTLKYLLIFLLVIVPVSTVPAAGQANGDADTLTALVGDASLSGSDHTSEHSHGNQGSDCCHSICVCCVAQSSLVTTVKIIGGIVNARQTPGIRSTNLPNPHLKGLLRPPRFI